MGGFFSFWRPRKGTAVLVLCSATIYLGQKVYLSICSTKRYWGSLALSLALYIGFDNPVLPPQPAASSEVVFALASVRILSIESY